jgi:hypothetical protein
MVAQTCFPRSFMQQSTQVLSTLRSLLWASSCPLSVALLYDLNFPGQRRAQRGLRLAGVSSFATPWHSSALYCGSIGTRQQPDSLALWRNFVRNSFLGGCSHVRRVRRAHACSLPTTSHSFLSLQLNYGQCSSIIRENHFGVNNER